MDSNAKFIYMAYINSYYNRKLKHKTVSKNISELSMKINILKTVFQNIVFVFHVYIHVTNVT